MFQAKLLETDIPFVSLLVLVNPGMHKEFYNVNSCHAKSEVAGEGT